MCLKYIFLSKSIVKYTINAIIKIIKKKEEPTINELDKAKAVVTDKNNSFAKLKKGSGVSIPTLKAYRADPEKLRTARWSTVHKLASMYNK
ncbi:hypothetical protein [Limosilactobacillus fermentum]|uniref:hypothetical protein n=1 Tax=Limosilactobacillus fermentum TaxID=1613 RepID=UPI000665060C|nr:hypothetical protein [Limosilactobacillus fermentum]DAO15789.1 MAG TPA: hypothetical protein [Caudoviricetes sp.]